MTFSSMIYWKERKNAKVQAPNMCFFFIFSSRKRSCYLNIYIKKNVRYKQIIDVYFLSCSLKIRCYSLLHQPAKRNSYFLTSEKCKIQWNTLQELSSPTMYVYQRAMLYRFTSWEACSGNHHIATCMINVTAPKRDVAPVALRPDGLVKLACQSSAKGRHFPDCT